MQTAYSSARMRGSIMPFIAVTAIVLMGALGICTDLQRDFQAASELQFAAESAAIYGLSLSTNADGSYSLAEAQSNISTALESSYAAINSAELGPQTLSQSPPWSGPVTFAPSDINFVQNPNLSDSNDFFLQLTGRRDGNNALMQFFLPILGTSIAKQLPPSFVNSVQTVEVIGQPASRIGAGALSVENGMRANDLVGFASLPLAISNQQFAQIADPSQTTTNYTVDLVSSQSVGNSLAPNHLKGCFVNPVLDSSQAYASASGDQSIDQFKGLFNYFAGQQQAIAPSLLERGSALAAFDPLDPAFVARQAEINQSVLQLPINQYYIIPVLANDPTFVGSNEVVGFARLLLAGQPTIVNGAITSFSVQLGDSVPVRNAVAVAGSSNLDTSGSTMMPAPVYPFLPRQIDLASGGISARARGIVMAPSLSPRRIRTST